MSYIPYPYGYDYGGGGGGLVAIFSALLQTSLTPNRFIDSTVTEPAAASIRMVEDSEGLFRRVKSGELRFRGARRVANLVRDMSDAVYADNGVNWSLTNSSSFASFTDNGDGTSTLRLAASGDFLAATDSSFTVFQEQGMEFILAVDIAAASGEAGIGAIRLVFNDGTAIIGSVIVTPDSTTRRYFVRGTTANAPTGTPYIRITGSVGSVDRTLIIGQIMFEETSGQASPEAASYVDSSVDFNVGNSVLGVENQSTTNGNTGADTTRTDIIAGSDAGEVTEAAGTTLTPEGYFVEPQSINLVPDPINFSVADGWTFTQTPTVTGNVTTAPDGRVTASTIEDNNAASFEGISHSGMTITANGTVTTSIYVLKDAISRTTRFPMFQITLTGGTTAEIFSKFDTSTGEFETVITVGTLTIVDTHSEELTIDGVDWWRFVVTITDTTSNTSAQAIWYPSAGSSLTWVIAGSTTGTVTCWGFQFEELFNSSTLIPFSGTRAADFNLNYALSNFPLTLGSAEMDYIIPIASTVSGFLSAIAIFLGVDNNFTDGRVFAIPIGSSSPFADSAGGVLTQAQSPTYAAGASVRLRLRWNATTGDFNISISNGLTVVDDATPGTTFTTFTAATFMRLFANAPTNQDGSVGIGQSMSNLKIYDVDRGDDWLNEVDPFDPVLLGPAVWYDPSEDLTVTGSGVSSYPDQSGNGNTQAQVTDTNRPAFNATGINGFPSLTFDGSDNFMVAPDDDSLDMTADITFFAVINSDGVGSTRNILSKGTNESYRWRIQPGEQIMIIHTGSSGTTAIQSTSTISNATDIIVSATLDTDGDIIFRQNGVSLGTVASGGDGTITVTTDGLFMGTISALSEFFKGEIGTNGFFPFLLSDAEHNQVGNFLADQYGLTWTDI